MTTNWIIEKSLIKGLFSKSWHALGISESDVESSGGAPSLGLGRIFRRCASQNTEKATHAEDQLTELFFLPGAGYRWMQKINIHTSLFPILGALGMLLISQSQE